MSLHQPLGKCVGLPRSEVSPEFWEAGSVHWHSALSVACHGVSNELASLNRIDISFKNCCAFVTSQVTDSLTTSLSLYASQETLRQEAASLMGCADVSKGKINGMQVFPDQHALCLGGPNGCGGEFGYSFARLGTHLLYSRLLRRQWWVLDIYDSSF